LKALIDIVNDDGLSILHINAYGNYQEDDEIEARSCENIKFFQLVIDRSRELGLDPSIRDIRNFTAKDIAIEQGHHNYVKMLEKYIEEYKIIPIKEPSD
jgi:ankyrin repeat protein